MFLAEGEETPSKLLQQTESPNTHQRLLAEEIKISTYFLPFPLSQQSDMPRHITEHSEIYFYEGQHNFGWESKI